MPTPPTPNYASFDFSNPLSYPGTGNTIYDLTPLNNDLTNTTGLAGTFGGTGQSKYYSFTGGSDQFWKYNCSSDGFVAGKLYTASEFLWVRSSNWVDTGNLCLAGWGDDIGVGGGQLGIWKNFAAAGPGLIAMMGSGVGLVDFPTNPTDNEWHHLGYVADGSGCTVYLDGTAVATVPQNFYFPSGTGATGYVAIQIPQAPFMALGGLAPSYYPAGGFDLAVAEFYNTALDGTQVSNLYDYQSSRFNPTPTPTQFLKYDFQDPACYSGSGTTINDLAGTNTELFVDNGNWVSGTVNYWDLQGDTILENTNPPTELNSNIFTVNCWYYPDFTNPSTYASVWGIGLNNPNQMPILSTQSTGSFNIQWSYGYNLVSYTPTIDWHLVTFVSDGTDTILYIDGVLEGSVNGVGTIGTIGGVTRLRLGCSNSSGGSAQEPAYGRIGYWDYHTVALTAGEISALYDATKTPYITPPPSPSIVGGRSFGQGFNG